MSEIHKIAEDKQDYAKRLQCGGPLFLQTEEIHSLALCEVYAMVENGSFKAAAALLPQSEDICILQALTVCEEEGQKGFETMMLEVMADLCRPVFQTLLAAVPEADEGARRFLERCGFTPAEPPKRPGKALYQLDLEKYGSKCGCHNG